MTTYINIHSIFLFAWLATPKNDIKMTEYFAICIFYFQIEQMVTFFVLSYAFLPFAILATTLKVIPHPTYS